MTGAPLPPHERAWRHPSEVGQAVHEPPNARSHAIMVSTAAVGLLLVALLAVAVTPGGSPSEVASPGTMPAPVRIDEPSASLGLGTETRSTLVSAATVRVTTTVVATTLAVIVPIDDGVALMTQPGGGPVRAGERVVAARPGGAPVTALVVATDDSGLVVVSVPADLGRSYQMAPTGLAEPAPDDTVHVHGREVAVVTMEALATLEVADGTPVTDADGQLLGLCVEDPASGDTTMMVIDRARVDAIDGSD